MGLCALDYRGKSQVAGRIQMRGLVSLKPFGPSPAAVHIRLVLFEFRHLGMSDLSRERFRSGVGAVVPK